MPQICLHSTFLNSHWTNLAAEQHYCCPPAILGLRATTLLAERSPEVFGFGWEFFCCGAAIYRCEEAYVPHQLLPSPSPQITSLDYTHSKTSAMAKTNVHKSCHSAVGKQPLKRFTIAISGNFGEQRSVEKMRQWVHANGGTVASDISAEVTHLVCSKEHFKKDVAMGMTYSTRMEHWKGLILKKLD